MKSPPPQGERTAQSAGVGLRGNRVEQKVDGINRKVDGLGRQLNDLTKNLPKIVAHVVREVNRETGRKRS